MTHGFNGMSGLDHRAPGMVGALLTDDRVAVSLIADLVHVHPAALSVAFRCKPVDQVVLVTDAVAWQRGNVGGIGLVHDGTAPRLPDGTLAGSALTLDQAVANVVGHCGVTLERAVAAASTNPARLLGLADRGAIETGRRADLVALDPDTLRATETWIEGRRSMGRAASGLATVCIERSAERFGHWLLVGIGRDPGSAPIRRGPSRTSRGGENLRGGRRPASALGRLRRVHIVGAFFIESIDLRQVAGPSTRIDLTGVHFSLAAPSPVPVTLEPHLLVLVHCPEDATGTGALEVTYQRDGEQVARNVQPLEVEPGKFNYRLVRAELRVRGLRHGRGPLPHRLRRRDRGAVHPAAPGGLTCPSPPPSPSTRSPPRRPARRWARSSRS